ncbi:MAG: hypothetical protein L3J76_01135 [Candidatus Hydrothermae bacterium]|nr:hypothetical protein [Candidatus Hydrothermae bacterium]
MQIQSARDILSLVAYIRSRLEETLYMQLLANRRTAIQKIAYLALSPDERKVLYRPYLYGPYSDAIQGAIVGFEQGDFDHALMKDLCLNKRKQSVERVIARLAEEKVFTLRDLVLLTKVHLLTTMGETTEDPELVKTKARRIGWREILELDPSQLMHWIKKAKKFN